MAGIRKSDIAAILALPEEEREAALAALAAGATATDFREGIRARLSGSLPLPPGYAGVAEVIAEEVAATVGLDAATVARIAYATNYGYGAVRKAERAKGNRLDGKR